MYCNKVRHTFSKVRQYLTKLPKIIYDWELNICIYQNVTERRQFAKRITVWNLIVFVSTSNFIVLELLVHCQFRQFICNVGKVFLGLFEVNAGYWRLLEIIAYLIVIFISAYRYMIVGMHSLPRHKSPPEQINSLGLVTTACTY